MPQTRMRVIDGDLLKGNSWTISDVFLLQEYARDELVEQLQLLFVPEQPYQQRKLNDWTLAPAESLPVKVDDDIKHWFTHNAGPQMEPLLLS